MATPANWTTSLREHLQTGPVMLWQVGHCKNQERMLDVTVDHIRSYMTDADSGCKFSIVFNFAPPDNWHPGCPTYRDNAARIV